MREVTLQPGEFYFGQDDTIIRTHLGSCVAITMWHPEQKRGGMCHYMLPSRGHSTMSLDGRYADEAIQLFINEISKHPAPIHEYEVKLFGGGNMFIEQQTLTHHECGHQEHQGRLAADPAPGPDHQGPPSWPCGTQKPDF